MAIETTIRERTAQNVGLWVILLLAVLTAIEFIVFAVVVPAAALILLLIPIALFKAWLIINFFMHVARAWHGIVSMATEAVTHVTPAVHEDPARSLQIKRVGLWLFFLSDGLLFALFATTRFYLVGTETPSELSQVLGLGITAILLLSSLTAFRAETAIAHGNVVHARRMLLATIVLGAVFVSGVVVEWSIAHFTPSDGYGTAFFSMTGMHATHVVSGIVLLAMAYVLIRRGRFSMNNHWGLAAIVLYWHFVDVVWVFFYPALYLVR